MGEVRAHQRQLSQMPYRHQREDWLLDAAAIYCDAVASLAGDLASAPVSSRAPHPTSPGAVSHLEAYVARLRQLRKVADDHTGTFGSEGLTALSPPCSTSWTTLTSRRSATTSGSCGSAPGC